nr:histone deacetylase 14 [Tanacetum cinerariifolium]
LDEDWFILDANLLREALEITPIDQSHRFKSPPSGRKHNINHWSGSSFNMAADDHRLGNLEFVPKGEEDEVFRMQIPNELITDSIRNAPYYNAYLEMVAKHDYKIAAKEGGKKKLVAIADQSKKPATAKQPKPISVVQSKPAPAKQVKPVKEKSTPIKKAAKAPEFQVEDEEYDLQQGIQMGLELFQAPGQAPVGELAFREPASGFIQKLPIVEVTKEASIGPSVQPEDNTFAHIVFDTPSPTDAETGAENDKKNSEGGTEILSIGEEQGEDVANKVNLEEKTTKIDEGQAGSDSGKTLESRPPPKCVLIEEDQVGPDPRQIHVALAGLDPEPMHDDFVANVYPQVHDSLNHPDEEHVHVENPLSSTRTLSSMKNLDAYTFGDPLFNGKPTEKDLGKTNMETKVESMVTISIHQVVFTLELRDMPHKIDQTVNEAVKEAVQVALQALLRERFRDLSEADMKEILYDQMFESGSYMSQSKHDKSRKRRRDDQDLPPPPSKEPDKRKKKKHDSDASGSIQTSSAWKTSDTRDAPSSSSKQKSASISEQHVHDILIPDDVYVSNIKDIDVAHLPKINPRPDWLKPVPEEERPKTPEPDWVVPPNDLPEPENNWANAFATSLGSQSSEKPIWKDQLTINPEGHRVVPDVSKPLPLGDYTIVSKPRVIIYKDMNDQKKMMRDTEVHKFSDDTLTRILEKLNHMVKDLKLFKYNPSMETRIWYEDDRRRSKEFMEMIERRLKIRRIFRSLKSFMSGSEDGNPAIANIKQALGRVKFITACSYSTNTYVEIMKVQVKVSMLSQALISTSSSACQSNEVMM